MLEKKENENPSQAQIHLVVFKLGNEDYGIRIEQVKEVTVTPEIAKMPKTPPFIKGVANIRGDIIAIMDLRDKFHISKESAPDKVGMTYTLVVESPDYVIGLVVNEVPLTLSVPVSQIDKTPNIIKEKNINENYIEGIAKTDDGKLVIVLDIFQILSIEEIEQLPLKTE